MLDKLILLKTKGVINTLARKLANIGIDANLVTIVGFLIGISVIPILYFQKYYFAIVVIVINRVFDALDGAISRITASSDRGGFIDIVADFIFYSGVVLAFAIANPEKNSLAAAVLIFSFVGTATSFLAFAIIAEKRNLTSLQYPNKSFYYLGGLTEATETIFVFILMCLLPNYFPYFAYVFSCLCLLTTGFRVYYGWKCFN